MEIDLCHTTTSKSATGTHRKKNSASDNQNIGPNIHFSIRTRKGKSNNSNKINQDSFVSQMNFQGKQYQHLFGVYDGHGVNGHLVSQYSISLLSKQPLSKQFYPL